MTKKILISSGARDTRVAIIENGDLVEFHTESNAKQRIVGNIYKGKVANVLPGMQAAFVNVGLPKNTFLYFDDALESVDGIDDLPATLGSPSSIKDVLKAGQQVLVQVSKDPFGSKGARVTRHISLPGRFVVLMPTVELVGISRRIASGAERDRLRKVAKELCPEGMGLILRTLATTCTPEEIKKDVDFLVQLWGSIKERSKTAKVPSLLHKDFNLVYGIMRDSLDRDVEQLVVDSADEYQHILNLLDDIDSAYKDKVLLYQDTKPMFETFGIEGQIANILRRRVWLKCGGYLVIDQAEALTSIDVNTGKFVGVNSLSETILKTNLEAAREIARQLRLRNIGGIIVIDFIGMEISEHQKQVLSSLEQAMQPDKVRSTIVGITGLGLVELTRQKVRLCVSDLLQKTCPCCEGSGRVLSDEFIWGRIEEELRQLLATTTDPAVLLEAHPAIAGNLIGENAVNLEKMEEETGKRIFIRGSEQLARHEHRTALFCSVEEASRAAIAVAVGEIHTLPIESVHHSRPLDGVARLQGYVIQVEQAARLVGKKATFEIIKAQKTFATARLYPG